MSMHNCDDNRHRKKTAKIPRKGRDGKQEERTMTEWIVCAELLCHILYGSERER